MRQKNRPLLLLKKQLGAFQRVRSGTYAIGNRLMNDVLFGAPRPLEAWSDGKDCGGGGNVVVEYSAAVYYGAGAGDDGITITATGGKTFNGVAASASGEAVQQYTGSWSTALDGTETVTIAYDDTVGSLRDTPTITDDTNLVRSFTQRADNCLAPPEVVSIKATNATGTNQHIIVQFDRLVTGDGALGVTWTGLDQGAAHTNPTADKYISYIVNPGDTLYNDDVVTWSYAKATGDIVRSDSLVALEDVTAFSVDMSGLDSRPPVSNPSWSTETGGVWQTESGGNWLLEE